MQNISSIVIWGTLVGVSLLSAAIWEFSPLLGAPFNQMWLRAILATIPLLLWALVWFLVSRQLKKRKAGVLKNAVIQGPEAQRAEAAAREEAELRQKINETWTKLKSSTGRKVADFISLPRFLMIGPPGSGKSVALRNSGLDFLAADHDAQIRGSPQRVRAHHALEDCLPVGGYG